ncbi:glycosyltransferase family 39 protein [Terriglobus sp.]|uniref:glycosyltransferase family 39 protein n=1 Tax=Terriglobus sp. TaxID=1889013 RepID=UPI003B0068BF
MNTPQERPGGVAAAVAPRQEFAGAGVPVRGGGVLAACSILLLTAVLALVWSHARLMWNDEFLSFYSDSVPTLAGVLRVQMHSPISLDPPAYHLLSHLSMDVVGRGGTALRLPALCGFLLLEWSLFLLVRRIAGHRAALLAMALPLCTASFRYAVEGRPYGLLLGLYAAAVVCWYFATQSDQRTDGGTEMPRSRWVPLLGLFLSIALAITSHYFGLLILLPVSAGELVRTVQRRRFDWPVVGTLAAGLASVALILPGKAALQPYQRHYYTSSVNLHNVSQGYRELFVRYNTWPVPLQRVCAAMLALLTVWLLWAMVRRLRQGAAKNEPSAFWAAMLALAVLPFFGYLFGKFVTHTMEVRYVIAALIPFAVSIALLLERRLRSARFFYGALGAVVALAVVLSMVQIRAEQRRSEGILRGMKITGPLHDLLVRDPARRLYTQSLGDFFLDGYYAPDPVMRERMTLVYDEGSEVRWLHHNTNAVTAVNLQKFTRLPTVPYPQMLTTTGALLLDYRSGWEWIGDDLCTRGVFTENLGAQAGAMLFQLQPTPYQSAVGPAPADSTCGVSAR